MEVMEEGNLMDRIPILLSRDMEYYEVLKSLLRNWVTWRLLHNRDLILLSL